MIWQPMATWKFFQPYLIENYWLVQHQWMEERKWLKGNRSCCQEETSLVLQNVAIWKGLTIDLSKGYLNSRGKIQYVLKLYIITGIYCIINIFRLLTSLIIFFRITSSILLRRWYLQFFKRRQKKLTLLKLRISGLENWVKSFWITTLNPI